MGLTRLRAEQISDIDYKQAVRVITVTNVTLAGGAPTPVDGVNLSVGDRVLVTGQSTGSQNGIYQVQTVGSGSNGTWIRSSDTNATGELEAGTIVMVTEGTIYADTQWKLITDDPIVIGTTALTFTQNYSANSISSGTSNVVINSNAAVTISSAGTANVVSVSNTAVTFTGNLFPSSNVTYSLGNTALRWKDLWLANSTLYIGDVSVAATGSALTVNGANVLVGNAGSAFSTSGNVTGGNLLTAGLISATGNLTVGGDLNLIGNIVDTGPMTLSTTSNGNITLSPNGTGLVIASCNISTAGNVITGNILTNGYYYANGVVFGGGGGVPGGANTQIQFNDNGTFNGTAGLTFNKTTNAVTTTGTFSATANITGGNILTAGFVSVTGNLTVNGMFNNGSYSGVGNVFAPNVDVGLGTVFVGNVVNTNANSVGNIGSSGLPFNTVFAKATSAQYADLAEMYLADAGYVAGTVMEFGGSAEVTQSSHSHSIRVAGIVSTNPSYLMNATLTGQHVLPVALVGRVPCQVVGTIAKGDRLVTSDISGVATTLDLSKYQPACIIGKSLENYDSPEVGVIEVAVGRT